MLALAAMPFASELQYDRGRFINGEVWRLATCQWTHWSIDHLAWDVAVFVVLGIAAARRNLGETLATIAIATLSVSIAVHVASPGIWKFRGLSGIDSALFGLAVARLSFEGRRSIAVALALAAGFAAKVTYESATGGTVFARSGGAFVAVPLAHGMGFSTGVLVAMATQFLATVGLGSTKIAERRHRAKLRSGVAHGKR